MSENNPNFIIPAFTINPTTAAKAASAFVIAANILLVVALIQTYASGSLFGLSGQYAMLALGAAFTATGFATDAVLKLGRRVRVLFVAAALPVTVLGIIASFVGAIIFAV